MRLGVLLDLALAAGVATVAASDGFAQADPSEVTIGFGRGLDSLSVRHLDGTRTEAIELRHLDGVAYLTLGDLARLTGEGYAWNPETFRGSFDVDSTEVGFVLGSPILWVGGRTRQIEADVRLAEEEILIPAAIVSDILVPQLGDRCRWDAPTGRLSVAKRAPWITIADVDLQPGRLIARVGPLPDARAARVRHDPNGQVGIEVRGISLPPDFVAPTAGGRGVKGIRAFSRSDGFELRFSLDRNWIGLRSRYTGSDRVLTLELTESATDLDGGAGFEPLVSYGIPAVRAVEGRPRRIVLERAGPADSSTISARVLGALSQELRMSLEREFGYEVVPSPDRELAARLSGRDVGPAPTGECWIGLRLERYPSTSAREFLLVVPEMPVRWETVAKGSVGVDTTVVSNERRRPERGSFWRRLTGRREEEASGLTGIRPVPWGQTARVEAAASRALAENLAAHLRAELGDRPVRVVGRPSRVFRGIAMPAVILYPGSRLDDSDLEDLADPDRIRRTARSIAFGIDEYLLSLRTAP